MDELWPMDEGRDIRAVFRSSPKKTVLGPYATSLFFPFCQSEDEENQADSTQALGWKGPWTPYWLQGV